MSENPIFHYFFFKFGSISTMLILFAPSFILIYPAILSFKKRITVKQNAMWIGLCLGLEAIWVVIFFGLNWWLALLSAPMAFLWGKWQTEALSEFAEKPESDSRKIPKQ